MRRGQLQPGLQMYQAYSHSPGAFLRRLAMEKY